MVKIAVDECTCHHSLARFLHSLLTNETEVIRENVLLIPRRDIYTHTATVYTDIIHGLKCPI